VEADAADDVAGVPFAGDAVSESPAVTARPLPALPLLPARRFDPLPDDPFPDDPLRTPFPEPPPALFLAPALAPDPPVRLRGRGVLPVGDSVRGSVGPAALSIVAAGRDGALVGRVWSASSTWRV